MEFYLRDLMELLGYKERAFAKVLGVTQGYVSKMVRGHKGLGNKADDFLDKVITLAILAKFKHHELVKWKAQLNGHKAHYSRKR